MAQAFTWIDADGGSTDLNEYWDFDGRYMPPVDFITDKLPGRNGEVFRHVRHGARVVKLAMMITQDCALLPADLQNQLRALVYAMDPTRGSGILRITNPGTDQREIECRYASGLELPEKLSSTSSKRAQRVSSLSLIAHEPYWRATGPTVIPFTAGSAINFFPFFPLHLTTSQIFTTTTIVNPGNVPSWPIWKITGPGSTIVLLNVNTGQKLDFSNAGGLTIPDGEVINIDTSEGIKSVTRESDGVNLFKYLSNDSELWPIPKGSTTLQLQMSGAIAGVSNLQLIYTPRYLTV